LSDIVNVVEAKLARRTIEMVRGREDRGLGARGRPLLGAVSENSSLLIDAASPAMARLAAGQFAGERSP